MHPKPNIISDRRNRVCSGTGSTPCYFSIDNIVVKHDYELGVLVCDDVEGYRFGFNGVEKENDLYGDGNAYSFEYRIHDPRIGRFLSVDPLYRDYPWNSTYAFAENRVIDGIDLEGLEHQWYVVTLKNDGSTILSTRRVNEWAANIKEVGPRGWGKQYTYVNEQNEFVYSAFIPTPTPFFKGFPDGKQYINGRLIFDEDVLIGSADGANTGAMSAGGFKAVGNFVVDVGLSGGNPVAIGLAMNDLTKNQISTKLKDNSGNSSLLSYSINMGMGLDGADVFGKDVVSAISLLDAGKGFKDQVKDGTKQFGADVWEYAKTIYDAVKAGEDVYDILSGNFQDKPKPQPEQKR